MNKDTVIELRNPELVEDVLTEVLSNRARNLLKDTLALSITFYRGDNDVFSVAIGACPGDSYRDTFGAPRNYVGNSPCSSIFPRIISLRINGASASVCASPNG